MKNYGTIYPIQSEKHKQKRIENRKNNGTFIEKSEYQQYRNIVERLTRNIKSELFKNWDGLDNYDGEYIRDNFKLHHYDGDYPSIDHIYLVVEGFKNNINPAIISDISNLCITKRRINSKKHDKIIFFIDDLNLIK